MSPGQLGSLSPASREATGRLENERGGVGRTASDQIASHPPTSPETDAQGAGLNTASDARVLPVPLRRLVDCSHCLGVASMGCSPCKPGHRSRPLVLAHPRVGGLSRAHLTRRRGPRPTRLSTQQTDPTKSLAGQPTAQQAPRNRRGGWQVTGSGLVCVPRGGPLLAERLAPAEIRFTQPITGRRLLPTAGTRGKGCVRSARNGPMGTRSIHPGESMVSGIQSLFVVWRRPEGRMGGPAPAPPSILVSHKRCPCWSQCSRWLVCLGDHGQGKAGRPGQPNPYWRKHSPPAGSVQIHGTMPVGNSHA